jgi:integrase
MAARKSNKLPNCFADLSPPPADSTAGYRMIKDHDIRRLYLRITKTGAKSWVHVGARSYTIGTFDDWPYPRARERARELNRLIDDGKDPHAEREARKAAPTVNELIEKWRDDVQSKVPSKLRPGTVKEYEGMIRQWIAPYLGDMRVPDVTPDDIEELHRKITVDGKNRGTPSRANHVVAFASTLFSLAVRKRVRTDNPCAGVERNREVPRFRMLSGDEFGRLLTAISECRNPQSRRAMRVSLTTGARRGEVLGMRWDQLDLTSGTWLKQVRDTKQKALHHFPLPAPARADLGEIRREQEERAARTGRPMPGYVFPAAGKRDVPVREISTAWHTVCKRAGLEDLHFHDLRHVFASYFASTGTGLPLIGRLLGHSQSRTTERYSHVHLDPLRAEVERFGAFIAAVEKDQSSGEVVTLPGSQRVRART